MDKQVLKIVLLGDFVFNAKNTNGRIVFVV